MKVFHLFLLLFFGNLLRSQTADNGKIVALHPSVGNTIDVNEKKQFSLFPEYSDSLFESAELVKYNDTTYTFLIKTITGKSFERAADFKERQSDYNKIESLKPALSNSESNTDYYSQKREKDEKARSRQEASDVAFEIFFDVLSFTLYMLQNFHQ